jgi:hypothetical protein
MLLCSVLLFVPSKAISEEKPDFSKGFGELSKLLPPLPKDVVWAKDTTITDDVTYGWWSPSTKELCSLDGSIIPLKTQSQSNDENQREDEAASEVDGTSLREALEAKEESYSLKTAPQIVEVTETLKSYYAILNKIRKKNQEDPDDFESEDATVSEGPFAYLSATQLLRFATQIWSTGQTQAAHELAFTLFQAQKNPEELLNTVIDEIATERLGSANQTVITNGDWKAYHVTLSEICSTFTRGWTQIKEARAHLATVQQQLNAKPISFPILKEFDTPENQALLHRLITEIPFRTKLQKPYGEGVYETWLLDTTALADAEGPLAEILKRRWDAIPLLVACLNDTTLIRVGKYQQHNRGYAGSYLGVNNPSEEKLARPQTLGELALAWLQPLFQISLEPARFESLVPRPKELGQQLLQEIYLPHRSKTAAEFRWYCIEKLKPKNSLCLAATAQLLAQNDASELRRLETWLETQPPYEIVPLVRLYLAHQKATASAFFDRYAKRLKEAPAPKLEPYENDTTSATILKALQVHISDHSLNTILAKLAKNETNIKELAQNYRLTFPNEITEKDFATILAAADAAAEETLKMRYVEYLYMMRVVQPQADPERKWFLNKPEHKALWSGLLNSNQPYRSPVSNMFGRSIGKVTAAILDFSHLKSDASDEGDTTNYFIHLILRSDAPEQDLFTIRARELIDNKSELTPLPSLKIADDALEKLQQAASKQSAETFADWFEKLSYIERGAMWHQMYREGDYSSAWGKAQSLIHEVRIADASPWAKVLDWKSYRGKPFRGEMWQEMVAALKSAKAPAGKIVLRTNDAYTGLVLEVSAEVPTASVAEMQQENIYNESEGISVSLGKTNSEPIKQNNDDSKASATEDDLMDLIDELLEEPQFLSRFTLTTSLVPE